MGFIDVVILIVTLGILGSILFFTFYNKKRNKGKCHGCPYKTKCASKTCAPDKTAQEVDIKDKNEKKEG